jgi:hypothetical protein
MTDDDANLTEEERAELANPVIEDEDVDGVEDAPDEALETPTDMPGEGLEDDSGFLEDVIEDDDPILNEPEGTRVGLGVMDE